MAADSVLGASGLTMSVPAKIERVGWEQGRMVLRLARELDAEADEILGAAGRAEALRTGRLNVVIIAAKEMRLEDPTGKSMRVQAAKDARATWKQQNPGDRRPVLIIQCELTFETKAWAFLGANAGGVVDVSMTEKG